MSLAAAAMIAGVGMTTIGRRPGWGFLVVIVGMALPVSNVIAADVIETTHAIAADWWANLPLLQQMLVFVSCAFVAALILVLLALGLLRLIAWPFIGRRAADGLVAGLGVEALRGLFVGLFRGVFGLVISGSWGNSLVFTAVIARAMQFSTERPPSTFTS